MIEGPIDEEEVWTALKGMSVGKAPGIDGIPNEFYLSNWDVMKEFLVQLMNVMKDKGSMSLTQRTGEVVMVPKGEVQNSILDYRGLSLMCGDYKLFAKVLGNRLRKVIGKVIDGGQMGVPGRTMFSGQGRIKGYIEERRMDGGGVLALDWKAAYDCVERIMDDYEEDWVR